MISVFSPGAPNILFVAQANAPLGAALALSPADDALAHKLADEIVGAGGLIIALLLAQQAALVIAYWLASKAVSSDRGTFGNALKVWALHWITLIGIGFIAGLAAAFVGAAHGPSAIVLVALAALLLVCIICIAIPMKVYDIGIGRAIGLLLLYAILGAILDGVASFAFSAPLQTNLADSKAVQALPMERRSAVFSKAGQLASVRLFHIPLPAGNVDALPGELAAGDRSKPLAEREAALSLMYNDLERRQKQLSPNDAAAKEKFAQQVARYKALLEAYKADAAAAPQQGS